VAKYGIKPALTDTGWSWLGGAVTLAAISTTLLMARFLWIIWRIEPHPAKGYVWGAAAWGGLILLVLLYPLVLGSPSAWISDAGPIGIGIGIAGLMALVAWRKPRLLRPLVGLIGPGDLLALVRPILAVLKLLARTLWRGWVWFLEWALSALRGALAPLEPQARDPERRLRAWPTAGSAWLVITVLLLVLLLTATPQGPPIETTPTPAAVTRVEAEPATTQDAAESGAAVPETTRQPGVILIDEPPLPTPGAEPGTTAPERPEMREMPPPVPTPVPEAAAAVPVADCDTQDRLVLRHRAVAQPLELAPCVRDQGIPRQGAAPPLTNRLVELVQHHLKDLGYAPGPLDGLIGPRTLDAVRRFQRNQGLADTGVISFDLLERIQSANPGALDRADPGPDPGPGMGAPASQRSP